MSLRNEQQSARLTSFLIKDILASNEQESSDRVLYEDSLSSSEEGSPECTVVTEGEQDLQTPFPFSESFIGFNQSCIGGDKESRVHKDRFESKTEENPNRPRFDHLVSSGKFDVYSIDFNKVP
jgi:hypothetical protein